MPKTMDAVLAALACAALAGAVPVVAQPAGEDGRKVRVIEGVPVYRGYEAPPREPERVPDAAPAEDASMPNLDFERQVRDAIAAKRRDAGATDAEAVPFPPAVPSDVRHAVPAPAAATALPPAVAGAPRPYTPPVPGGNRATPEGTRTRMPAPAAVPATAGVLRDVNLRAGPGAAYAPTGVAKAGREVRILRCDGWCEVEADAARGWIYRTFLDLP